MTITFFLTSPVYRSQSANYCIAFIPTSNKQLDQHFHSFYLILLDLASIQVRANLSASHCDHSHQWLRRKRLSFTAPYRTIHASQSPSLIPRLSQEQAGRLPSRERSRMDLLFHSTDILSECGRMPQDNVSNANLAITQYARGSHL